MNRDTSLEEYFEAYAAAAMGADPTAVASFYTDGFVAAGPRGSAMFKNDEHFIEWLRRIHEFNEETGMESLEVVSVRERPISDEYDLATVEWGSRFRKTGDELIRFEISYLLESGAGRPRILAYISHEDQEEKMSELGLL